MDIVNCRIDVLIGVALCDEGTYVYAPLLHHVQNLNDICGSACGDASDGNLSKGEASVLDKKLLPNK